MKSTRRTSVIVFSCIFLLAFTANAGQILNNGGFESGNLTGWFTADSAASYGSFYADNQLYTPLNDNATVGPQAGSWYAVSDAYAPGTHALTQTFTDPLGTTSALLSFSIFVNDLFGGGGTGGEVALFANGANPLAAAPLVVLWGPNDTAESSLNVPNAWVTVTNMNITGDLTAGTTYELSFLESDSTGPINVGVDSVSLVTTGNGNGSTPEPSMLIPTALLAAFFAYRARGFKRQSGGASSVNSFGGSR
jgi:hypothetical protein